jgi:alpha-glucosidase
MWVRRERLNIVALLGLLFGLCLAHRPAHALTGPLASGFEASNGSATIRVTALSNSTLRIRIAPSGAFAEDASWAVPARVRAQSVPVARMPNGFSTAALQVRVEPETLRITVADSAGRVLSSDAAPVRFDGQPFTLRKAMSQGEHYFGVGDKTGPFDRRGASYVNWNTDAWGYGASTDPLYKSIPFFVATGRPGGSYGLFLDNSWRSWFDFGHRSDGMLEIGADGGPVDYYLIAGASVADVVRRYTDLTGKAPLPPAWSFGFQQSRYSYMSDAEVRELAARLRQERIPTDVIWLDIDFQDRNRPFTTNRQTFPDLRRLARDLKADGIKLVAITDLHIAHAPNEHYAPYDSGTAGDHFLKKPDGAAYVAPVWPGPSVFPDFTQAASRQWWGSLYRGFVDQGIAGFWNDMNEPAIFETPTKTMPLGTVHRIDGDGFAPRTATHAEIHNVYGMENSRATFEGLQRLRPDMRPFVMTRASFAGGQRYAVTWTGDNSATWDHLKLMVQQLLSLGLSGFPFAGADIGGFTGGPSPELLTRFHQIGAFTPIFRNHSAKDTPRAEVWVDGREHLAIRRRFIEERYRLLPYFYATAEQSSRTGDPVMRPVFYDYPEIASAYCDQSMSFTVGRQLLVAASPKPESPQAYDICLPAGGWFDYWSGLSVRPEPTTDERAFDVVKEAPRIDRLPVFVRAGAILPRQPLVQSTSETPKGPLSIDIYPGRDCSGELYADDGETLGYRRGKFLRQSIRCVVGKDGVQISFEARSGRFRPWWRAMRVTVHDWAAPALVRVRGRQVRAATDGSNRTLTFELPDQRDAAEIVVARR